MLSVLGDESPTAELGQQQQQQSQAKVDWSQGTTSQSSPFHFFARCDENYPPFAYFLFFSFGNRYILISLFFKMIHVVYKVLH